jgi:hypothetical protein
LPLPRLTAVEFATAFETGTTKPCVFQCEDSEGNFAGEYVTKLRATVRSNEIGLQYEVLAWALAGFLGIPRLNAALIEVDDQLADSVDDKVVRERISKSIGLNFGTEFVPGFSQWVAGCTIPPPLFTTAVGIVAFDALIENADRRRQKSNLLYKGDEVLVLDHELAFSFVLTIGLDLAKWDLKRLSFLDNHPFRAGLKGTALDLTGFQAKLAMLDDSVIAAICADIPPEFGAVDAKIPAHLTAFRNNASVVMDIIKGICK